MNNLSQEYIYVFWMNIGIEKKWMNGQGIIPKINVSKEQKRIICDSEQMCLLLKGENNIVILKHSIPLFLKKIFSQNDISESNVFIPKEVDKFENISEAILNDGRLIDFLKQLNIKNSNRVKLFPYAITNIEEKIAEVTRCEMIGPSALLAQEINDKIYNRHFAKRLNFPITEARECYSCSEIYKSIEEFTGKFPGNYIVLKEKRGASGKGIFLIKNEKDYKLLKQMLVRLNVHELVEPVLIEHWYENAMSINYQIFISEGYFFDILAITQQVVNRTVYVGSKELILEKNLKIKLEQYIHEVARNLMNINYRGIASIDALILEDKTIIPILEINGRMSLSSYPMLWKKKMKINNNISTFYFDINYKCSTDKLENYITNNLFSNRKQEGILPYVYSLPFNAGVKGRIFLLIVGKTEEYIEKVRNVILKLVS